MSCLLYAASLIGLTATPAKHTITVRMCLRLLPILLVVLQAETAIADRPDGPAVTPAGVGRFSPSLFRFVSVIPDDGKDEGGGWQEAAAVLKFIDGRHLIPAAWSCRVTVGMPFRTSSEGRITPEYAADVTATVATDASEAVMHRRSDWLPASFCAEFIGEMRTMFRERHRGLGARVR